MPFDTPDVHSLFAVPLLNFRLANADDLNRRLLTEIAGRRVSEPGVERSNRYGWHSDPDLFERKEPAHAELAREMRAMVEAATAKMLAETKAAQMGVKLEGWINVSPTHALNAPHEHPGSFWSGCYYVATPRSEDETDRFSGAIEFLDGRGSLGGAARIEASFTRGKFTVRPKAGTALLWPSFLRHWVHPNRAREDRVTAAFNAWFSRRPASAGKSRS
jgi:uncharacterized protein (TIGR02466 family)